MEGQRVLVLGAGGLVGSALARLLSGDNEVVGVDRFPAEGAADAPESSGVRTITMDVNEDGLGGLKGEFDYVFNEILLPPAACAESPDLAFRTHAFAVAELCQRFGGCKGLVFTSTGSVYRPAPEPVNEDAPLGGNGDPRLESYVLSKICGDTFAAYYSERLGTPTAILRYYQPYDVWPTRCPHSRVRRSADSIRRREAVQESPVLVNPIFVSDVARMTVMAASVAATPPTVINIGGEEVVSMRELAIMIGEAAGCVPRFVPCSDTVDNSQICDSARRIELLGKEQVSLREGIARVMASFPDQSAAQ